MTPQQFTALIRSKTAAIGKAMQRTLPLKVGALATAHFREGMRQGGFIDGGLERWPATRRQQTGTGAASQYGPLLSGRSKLYGSISHRVTAPGTVSVGTDVPYAAIHNKGGTVTVRVTPRMRRFAWAMYYKTGGDRKGKAKNRTQQALSEEARRWRALALTRKQQLTIRIPRRQFIGPSRTLTDRIEKKMAEVLMKIVTSE